MEVEILGPYGLLVACLIAIRHLYQENVELRKGAMDLLKKYQDRDEEERRLRIEQDRKDEEEFRRWKLQQHAGPSLQETRI